MTTGYLWTGQFKEVQSVIDEGKPQSMELDEESLEGHWATNVKNDMEFFIINDAVFTKLCILGDSTEPCFEGASVTRPEVSSQFSKKVDNNFKQTLFSMMKDLQNALKGGQRMEQEVKLPVEDFTEEQQEIVEPSEPVIDESTPVEESVEEVSENFEASEESQEESEPEAEFEKKEEDEQEDKEEEASDDTDDSDEEDKEDDDDKKKYSLLEQQYNELSAQYEQLNEKYQELVEFKQGIDNEKKDALINEFYMLSDEDKKDVIENKANYSLEEIKAKLAVICFERKVNFNSQTQEEIDSNKEQKIVTFSYSNDDSNLPDWVKAVKNNIDMK